ncbi:MAG: glycosyltransferase WbuB [Alphaproteobacteria bacterium]|nr:glycosyltransferase WbuB [Alphaproteobacteria bacterium]
MKLLFIALNHAPEQTGIGKYQGEMAAWYAARGHEVRAVVAPPYYPQWKVGEGYSSCSYKTEERDGVRLYRVPLYVPSTPSWLKRLVHLFSYVVSSFPVVLWQALFWRPEAIILTAPPLMAAPTCLLAAKLCRARSYLHIQDFEVDAAFNLGLLKRPWLYALALKIERIILRGFDGVSTISRKMREKLLEKRVPESKAFLVPNWANIEDFDPVFGPGEWRAQLADSKDTVLAVYAGNLGRKQGLETIIEAARRLEATPSIRFVISGDGAGRSDMEESAKGLTNVVFVPVQPFDSFRHLMLAADIHLLPQRREAADLVMPSKLGNILASGRPVVAGAEEGTQVYDAVQGCGIAVPPDDAVAFADAIEKLAFDPALRVAMGQKGLAQAKEGWSKDSLLSRMETLLCAGADASYTNPSMN